MTITGFDVLSVHGRMTERVEGSLSRVLVDITQASYYALVRDYASYTGKLILQGANKRETFDQWLQRENRQLYSGGCGFWPLQDYVTHQFRALSEAEMRKGETRLRELIAQAIGDQIRSDGLEVSISHKTVGRAYFPVVRLIEATGSEGK